MLRDGAQEETVNSLEEMQEFLDDCKMEYDKGITDMYVLASTIEDNWKKEMLMAGFRMDRISFLKALI